MKKTTTAAELVKILQHIATSVEANKDYLAELDSVVGDGDHGISMARGFRAVEEKLQGFSRMDCGEILVAVGATFVSVIGGVTGPIFGSWFMKSGQAVRGKAGLTLADYAKMFAAGLHGVQELGKAKPGDKTMIDALHPAVAALKEAAGQDSACGDLGAALKQAVEAACQGAEATKQMVARFGRSRYAGERALGHQDAGATSVVVILTAWAEAVAGVPR